MARQVATTAPPTRSSALMNSLRRSRPSSRARISGFRRRAGCEIANRQLASEGRFRSWPMTNPVTSSKAAATMPPWARPGAPSNARPAQPRRPRRRRRTEPGVRLVGFDRPPTARSSKPSAQDRFVRALAHGRRSCPRGLTDATCEFIGGRSDRGERIVLSGRARQTRAERAGGRCLSSSVLISANVGGT